MKIIYSLLLLLLVSSCHKHEDVIDTSIQVGSVVCSDGSILNPLLFNPEYKTAIGVVFWCRGEDNSELKDISALAVGLEDIGSFSLIDVTESIRGVSNDPDSFNGAENTAAYMNYAIESEIECPAVEACIKYSPNGVTGWFLPSAGECMMLNNNLPNINFSFNQVNAEEIEGWYWTSTADGIGENTTELFALVASINQGRITTSEKSNSFKVRPIIAIR